MLFEMTERERELVTQLIQRELDTLGPEIHHTDRRDYREELKVERRVLTELLNRLAGVSIPR